MDLNRFILIQVFLSSSYTGMIFGLCSVVFRVVMGPRVIFLRTRVVIYGHIQTVLNTFYRRRCSLVESPYFSLHLSIGGRTD